MKCGVGLPEVGSDIIYSSLVILNGCRHMMINIKTTLKNYFLIQTYSPPVSQAISSHAHTLR
jgi:hypothetical protein